MRKALVSLTVAGLLGGPLAGLAGANPIQYIKENGVPQDKCEWQEALAIVNVRACEEDW
jgi:hypothetical protein